MAVLPKRTLTQLIDAVTIESYPRPHLGASIIGHPCKRKVAYSFYWAHKGSVNGKLDRIFRMGDDIEPRIIKSLASIGIIVDGSQTQVKDSTGHAGGSCDGIVLNHPDFNEEILFEAKSANHNNFLEIKRKGVQLAKPTHYVQMNMYMARLQLNWGLYGLYDKNTSDLYFEVLPFDEECFKFHENVEHDILNMGHINEFAKMSNNPSWYECKTCDARDICHNGQAPARNCRTCVHSEMLMDGAWHCPVNKIDLTVEAQIAGCNIFELDPVWT